MHVSRPGADPLGIPAVFLYFLVRQRSRINPPTDKALKNLRGGQHVVVSERKCGVFYGAERVKT